MTNTVELMDRGMRCLVKELGVIEAEEFIMAMSRGKFDYTKWRHTLFDGMSASQLLEDAVQYAQEHPFTGKAKRL